jgi:hypothetical protein
VIVSHEALTVAFHVHEAAAVTVTVPVPPSDENVFVAGASV